MSPRLFLPFAIALVGLPTCLQRGGAPSATTAPAPSPSPIAATTTTSAEPALASHELPQGEFALVVGSAADACKLGAPPAKVYLSGGGSVRLLEAQPPLLDADGRFDGARLTLVGAAPRSERPTYDCVLREIDSWSAIVTADGHAQGDLVRKWEIAEGHGCAGAHPDLALPCTSRWTVTLDWSSFARAPHAGEAPPMTEDTTPAAATPTPKRRHRGR